MISFKRCNFSGNQLFFSGLVTCDLSALTRDEFKHSALGIIVDSRLGRSVPGAATDLGGPVQIATTNHLDVEHLDAIRTRRLSDLVGRLLKLNGGS